ncbi:MAG TPA: imidazolonepropionase, partial [Chitinophagaceae bacterium]|nr:imidazolonepropionase [Chitinophagaceae bacterium]
MKSIIINIKQLVNAREENKVLRGKELAELPVLENAYLIIDDGLISEYGLMKDLPSSIISSANIIDATHQFILPAWCDSHTHLVFAASRENEFVDKIKGLSYHEIAAKGGGILNSVKVLQQTSEEHLFNSALKRLNELIQLGTGAIEIKSGYGLTVDAELKMLRVINQLKKKSPIPIRSTFLGAHSFPAEFVNNHQGYIDLIINEMLPAIAKEKLADYIDVFCEEGFFNAVETEIICKAGMHFGLQPKIHANQFTGGCITVGVKLNAISVDHLETVDDDEIKLLASSNTIGTLLPTAAYFLRMPFQPARKLIDAGCAIALASDFNP